VVVQSVLRKWPGPAFVWPRLILKKLNNNTYKETVSVSTKISQLRRTSMYIYKRRHACQWLAEVSTSKADDSMKFCPSVHSTVVNGSYMNGL